MRTIAYNRRKRNIFDKTVFFNLTLTSFDIKKSNLSLYLKFLNEGQC